MDERMRSPLTVDGRAAGLLETQVPVEAQSRLILRIDVDREYRVRCGRILDQSSVCAPAMVRRVNEQCIEMAAPKGHEADRQTVCICYKVRGAAGR